MNQVPSNVLCQLRILKDVVQSGEDLRRYMGFEYSEIGEVIACWRQTVGDRFDRIGSHVDVEFLMLLHKARGRCGSCWHSRLRRALARGCDFPPFLPVHFTTSLHPIPTSASPTFPTDGLQLGAFCIPFSFSLCPYPKYIGSHLPCRLPFLPHSHVISYLWGMLAKSATRPLRKHSTIRRRHLETKISIYCGLRQSRHNWNTKHHLIALSGG